MKISVIVVTYNAGTKLKKTIDNIILQTYPQIEIIIKDGKSKDRSLDFLEGGYHPSISFYSEKDAGIYDAMNQAVSYATGDLLIFMNCGDYFYEPIVLEKMMIKQNQHPDAGIYYGDIYNRTTCSLVPMPQKITSFTCYRNIPCHQACLYEASLFQQRGYLTNYKIRADYEHFLWAFFEEGKRPIHVQLTVASYEGSGFSEWKENNKLDEKEHKEITQIYLSKIQIISYKGILLLTLAPLRRKIANSDKLSKYYQMIKKLLYRSS